MHNLTYKRILREDDADIPNLIAIYKKPEIAQYISIGDNYFHYVTTNEEVYFHKIYENNQLIGATHIERQGTGLFMDILVFPEFQKNGFGTKILKDIQNDVFELGFDRIEISIDAGNIASLRLFENAGFVCISQEDELLNYVYQLRTT